MYVYFEPQGGFNDILTGIKELLEYCKIYNRILLVNGMRTTYKINFSDYFDFSEKYKDIIILDTKKVKNICINPHYKIYPNELQDKMSDFLEDKKNLTYVESCNDGFFLFDNILLAYPKCNVKEDIIIVSRCGGADGYTVFKEIIFHQHVIDRFYKRYNKLSKPYLCIYIRNTDYKCDYITFFSEHEQQIRSFNEIYIATDDVNAIKFYINNGLQVKNFTTFPEKEEYSLHTSSINSHTKFIDMICDLLLISRSHTIMSNSKGCYILLAKAIKNGYWSW
jgi:hypothetical protein